VSRNRQAAAERRSGFNVSYAPYAVW